MDGPTTLTTSTAHHGLTAHDVALLLETHVHRGRPDEEAAQPLLGAFVVALRACFSAAPVDTPTVMFTRDYGHDPATAAYLVVSPAHLGWH